MGAQAGRAFFIVGSEPIHRRLFYDSLRANFSIVRVSSISADELLQQNLGRPIAFVVKDYDRTLRLAPLLKESPNIVVVERDKGFTMPPVFKSIGQIVRCSPIARGTKKLTEWTREQAKNLGMILEENDAASLSESCGGDNTAIYKLLELMAFSRSAAAYVGEHTVFDLIDDMMHFRWRQAISDIVLLEQLGENFVRVAVIITQHIDRVVKVKLCLDLGLSFQATVRALKLHPVAASFLFSEARYNSLGHLLSLGIELCQNASMPGDIGFEWLFCWLAKKASDAEVQPLEMRSLQ